ncbi:Asp-domain-containing protein [Amniculicola lignicola CBS 123094]|uniref:Asp-domain-containing protein n=1 Tax=Amniculicola lignicola CBS 123094 TaxID=1392246 RepID=A0A6A5VY05_9PLEO|nr:Asp-domain-containing protein [Amniculicola lignicola CBS 123094]
MPSFTTTCIALAAALSFATANPIDIVDRKPKGFSVHQVFRNKIPTNGAAQVSKTLKKYGAVVPAHIEAAAAAYQSGSVTAAPSDEYDDSYLSPVTVGGTVLELDFDTGSADLWVFSSLQASSQLSGHAYYKATAAKKLSGETWKISYGDGSGAAGAVYADTVVVGPVTATSQAVEAATSISSAFVADTDTDGLLGLAFSTINTVSPSPAKTFFDNVKASLPSPVFVATLKYKAAGTYDFGYIDSAKYTGAITYVPVKTSNGFWEFTATGYSVGTGAPVTTSIDAIADTGTTLAYLPTAVVKAYYAGLAGSSNSATYGGYVFPCATTPPTFSIVIAGVRQTIPGLHINYGPVTSGSKTCFGGIQDNTGIGFSILGDVFLKSKVVVFDGSATPRLGFAQQKGVS